MAKTTRRCEREMKEQGLIQPSNVTPFRQFFRPPPPVEPQTERQRRYLAALRTGQVTFGIGPAGTGKTYLAAAVAAELLQGRRVERVIVTRPAVEAGERFGFLPGELHEKYQPYLEPLMDAFEERLGKSHTEDYMKHGRLIGKPLAFMRGSSFKDALVIVDEAQNLTVAQMKLLLTRIGNNCRVVIDGDPEQTDIGNSGLLDAVHRLEHLDSVRVVQFGYEDVVRSGFCADVLHAYRNR